jgi:hypothetical protein
MDNLYEESIRSKIGEKTRKTLDVNQTRKNWNTSRGKRKLSVYEAKKVTDRDFDIITGCVKGMKESKKYSEYKEHLQKLCKMCMMPFDGLIIQRYNFQKGKKPNENYVLITYANTRQRIAIPNGSSLYHSSTLDNLKELQPFFQGKAARGYMYSAPRVYLTIRKNMNPLCADLKVSEKKTLYKVKEDIRYAYVDPLITGFMNGAVYVETMFPIAVEKVVPKKKVVKEDTTDIEEPIFASLEEFCEYYGFELIESEDDYMEESFKSKIGKISRGMEAKKIDKKEWKFNASQLSHKKIKKYFNRKDYKKIREAYQKMTSAKEYISYKPNYEYICSEFGLNQKDTSIKYMKFDNNEDKKDYSIEISYNSGRRKISLPNGVILVHTSTKPNIRELEPTFQSKRQGYYMWPSKRVYFSLGKVYRNSKAGIPAVGKTYHYTPIEKIQNAYIDADSPQFSLSSVYVDTQFPIKVKRTDEVSGIFKSITNKK